MYALNLRAMYDLKVSIGLKFLILYIRNPFFISIISAGNNPLRLPVPRQADRSGWSLELRRSTRGGPSGQVGTNYSIRCQNGAHVRSNLCHLICLGHLIRSKTVKNRINFSKLTYSPSCVRNVL